MANSNKNFPGCLCKETDVIKLRQYVNSDEKLIGLFCGVCKTESLIKEYVESSDDVETTDDRTALPELLPRPHLSENKAFQNRSSKTKVDLKYFADFLEPGDQISWHRPYSFWHHAIVSEIFWETNELELIHWNKENNQIKILRSRFPVDPNEDGLFNKMYRIDYPEEIIKWNDQELVLARARSRIGDTGYFPFADDCETFATYCKTGVEKSHQLAWVEGRFIGSSYSAQGMIQAYEARKEGNVSRSGFIETVIQMLVEGVLMLILDTIGLGLIGIAVGSALGPSGMIFGAIVGAIIGRVVGAMAGTALGIVLGKAISSAFKADDRAVTSIMDLKYGDHIVVYGWILHPRCHAIVLGHNGNDKIKVIRNSYKDGVVEEWIPFSRPLFKVEYQQGTSKDPEKVVGMARSKLGEKWYSLARYNCKTFARQCKSSLHVEPEEEPWELIDYDDIEEEALQQPCDTESLISQRLEKGEEPEKAVQTPQGTGIDSSQ